MKHCISSKKTVHEKEELISRGAQFENAATFFSPVQYVADLFPKHTALRFMGKNIAYKTLSQNVTAYAAAFRAHGLQKGEAVTFALPNIPESVYLLYAAAHAELRAAPLHPLSTPDAVASAMQKSGSRLVFVLSSAAKDIAARCPFAAVVAVSPAQSLPFKRILYSIVHPHPKFGGNLYSLRSFLRGAMPLPPLPFACPAQPETHILLQSGGTTGLPKVIGLSAAAVNHLAAKGLGILGREKVTDCGMLSVLPVFHGFGLAMGVHAMLCHGGKNVLFPKFHRASAVKEIRKGNVQFCIGVPRLYEALLSHPKFNGKSLHNLAVGFVGGDFVPHPLLHAFDTRIAAAGGTCRLFEGYGLTETVTVCCVNTAKENKDETVGKPLAGIEMAAFDFSVTPPRVLPPSEKGELCVTGDTLMQEYVSDKEGTDAVFFTHDGKPYVRSGDCGYLDEEGFVHFVSRYKRIIKVKGIPVYPLEIEQLAVAQNGVTNACVVAIPSNGEEAPVLFVESEDATLSQTLRDVIRARISPYAEPQQIIVVSSFPQTNVGKTDTKKLVDLYLRP